MRIPFVCLLKLKQAEKTPLSSYAIFVITLSYDSEPGMSMEDVKTKTQDAIRDAKYVSLCLSSPLCLPSTNLTTTYRYPFIMCSLAGPQMVASTNNFEKTKVSLEAVDVILEDIYQCCEVRFECFWPSPPRRKPLLALFFCVSCF